MLCACTWKKASRCADHTAAARPSSELEAVSRKLEARNLKSDSSFELDQALRIFSRPAFTARQAFRVSRTSGACFTIHG